MTDSRSALPDNIRAELARQRVPQKDVAATLGITQPAVSQKLSGRRPFTVDEVRAIADLLGVPAGILLGDEPVRSAS